MKRCIYCGTTEIPKGKVEFGDEHIIPLALGGNLVLPEASCDVCADTINQQIETPVLRQEWGALRSKREFPTRKKRRRKTHVTLYRRDGSAMSVSVKDYPAPIPLYRFKGPRLLTGEPRKDTHHWTISILADQAAEKEMLQKFPDWNGQHSIKVQPYPFARMLAKIAYGYVVAEWGWGAFYPLGLDIILGRSDDYFETVGGELEIPPPIPGGDHITDIVLTAIGPSTFRITVDIQLFSRIAMPRYVVVVGHIDLQDPQHKVAFAKHIADGKIPNTPI